MRASVAASAAGGPSSAWANQPSRKISPPVIPAAALWPWAARMMAKTSARSVPAAARLTMTLRSSMARLRRLPPFRGGYFPGSA